MISTVNQQPTSTPEQFASSLEMQRSAGQNALLLIDCRGEAPYIVPPAKDQSGGQLDGG